jgi:hypothetical protein
VREKERGEKERRREERGGDRKVVLWLEREMGVI